MIGLIGLDHHRAPAEVRGRLSFSGERLAAALRALAAAPEIAEVALLSTCNRTEVYVSAPEWPAARAAIARFLVATHALGPEAAVPAVPAAMGTRAAAQEAAASVEGPGLPLSLEVAALPGTPGQVVEMLGDLGQYVYEEEGVEAARHLMRVAAGLRSMLIGESQILGQVKDALAEAEATGSVGEELRALWTQAIKVGKRARTETQLGRVDRSLAAEAVRVASESLGGLAGKSALVIGAGRTSQLCAQQLRAEGIGRLVLANRSAAAAEELAVEVAGEPAALEDMCEALGGVELVISATAAPHVVLTAATVACGLAGRRAPLVIVDLAVPADVDPAAGLLPQVSLYTLDMLRTGSGSQESETPGGTEALAQEAAALAQAEALVEAGTREWARTRQMRQAVPGIAALRRHVDRSQTQELKRALEQLDRLGDVSDAEREVVERFGQRLVDKMFHHLVARIRSLAEYDEVPPDVTMRVLARLFADPDAGHPDD